MQAHKAAVAQVSSAVQAFAARNEPFRIFHGSSNTTRPAHGQATVDISALRNVISIDVATSTAVVEPNVPMDALVRATLAHGLVPPVVMEFPGITAGGGFAGSAGESSSFRHGYFGDGVVAVEMVLADGEVVTADKDASGGSGSWPSGKQRSSLLEAASGSLGTLGIVTLLTLRLVPARPFVELRYTACEGIDATVNLVRRAAFEEADRVDFVDAILFSAAQGVVMTGRLVDAVPTGRAARRFSRAWDEWFYLDARAKEQAAARPSVGFVTEYLPLAEYLFRYDRGAFWMGRHAFSYFSSRLLLDVPFNRATRYLLDDFLHARTLFRALHTTTSSPSSPYHVVQDLAFPIAAAAEFVSSFAAPELGIWPLWLCPLRGRRGPSFHPYAYAASSSGNDIADDARQQPEPVPLLNVGLWGPAPRGSSPEEVEREIERRVGALGGRKVLYGVTRYTSTEFWAVYGAERAAYERARREWGAEGRLPCVWEKITAAAAQRPAAAGAGWPWDGVRGVWAVVAGGEWRLHRDTDWMARLF